MVGANNLILTVLCCCFELISLRCCSSLLEDFLVLDPYLFFKYLAQELKLSSSDVKAAEELGNPESESSPTEAFKK